MEPTPEELELLAELLAPPVKPKAEDAHPLYLNIGERPHPCNGDETREIIGMDGQGRVFYVPVSKHEEYKI